MKSKTINRIKDMTKPYFKSIVIISLLSLIVSILEIAKPYIIEIVIDDYLSKGIYQTEIMTIGILGAIYIGAVIIREYNKLYSNNCYKYSWRECCI